MAVSLLVCCMLRPSRHSQIDLELELDLAELELELDVFKFKRASAQPPELSANPLPHLRSLRSLLSVFK